jgi:hypothetical protein
MEHLIAYNNFNSNHNFVRPEFHWSAEAKCLRIGEHYIFFEKNLVLERKDFESERLNEEWGLSSIMPDSVSDWMHLGVDVSSAIISTLGPFGVGASFLIDIAHAGAYFYEAEGKDDATRTALRIGGAITGIMAVVAIPAVKNTISAAAKAILTIGGKVAIIKAILGLGKKFGAGLVKGIITKLFGFELIGKNVAKMIGKYETSKVFKLLYKVPVFKKIIDFVRTKFTKITADVSTIMVKELNIYKMSLRKELSVGLSKSYKNLDSATKAMMDEKTFIKVGLEKAEKQYISKLTKENLAAKGGSQYLSIGKDLLTSKKLVDFGVKTHTANAAIIKKEVAEYIAANPSKKALQKHLETEALAHASKSKIGTIAAKEIPYEQLLKGATKRAKLAKVAGKSAAKSTSTLGTRAAFVIGKEYATDGYEELYRTYVDGDSSSSDSSSSSSDTSSSDSSSSVTASSTSGDTTNYDAIAKSMLEKFDSLRKGLVDTHMEIGNLNLVFKTPERTRQEDDDSGNLFIAETEIFNEQNITTSLVDYSDADTLLTDLKLLGIKERTKERLRDRELKKWQISKKLTTPYIKSEKCRFEFYFVVRERAKISLFRKNFKQTVKLAELTELNKSVHPHEINSSLYMIIKKVEKND